MLLVSVYHTALVFRGVVSEVAENRGGGSYLSIITPIKNEPSNIVEMYSSHWLEMRRRVGNMFECVVVADYTDNELFYDVLRRIHFFDGLLLIRRFNGFGGRNGAINDGVKFSSGNVIALLDVDAYPDENLLREMSSCNSVCVSWWRICDKGSTRSSSAIAFVTEYGSWLYYRNKFLKNLFIYPLGSGTVIRRDIFYSIGGLRTDVIQDDLWLGTQLAYRGITPKLLNPMCVGAPRTIAAFLIQQRRWAYGATDVLKRFGIYIAKSPLRVVAKIEAIAYLAQPLVASLAGIGFMLASIASFIESASMTKEALLLTAILMISIAMESICVSRFAEEFKGYDKPYVFGRASAITTIVSLAITPYVLAALIGVRIPYRVTPKNEDKSKDPTIYAIATLFLLSFIASVIRGNNVTLILTSMPLAASIYTLLRLD